MTTVFTKLVPENGMQRLVAVVDFSNPNGGYFYAGQKGGLVGNDVVVIHTDRVWIDKTSQVTAKNACEISGITLIKGSTIQCTKGTIDSSKIVDSDIESDDLALIKSTVIDSKVYTYRDKFNNEFLELENAYIINSIVVAGNIKFSADTDIRSSRIFGLSLNFQDCRVSDSTIESKRVWIHRDSEIVFSKIFMPYQPMAIGRDVSIRCIDVSVEEYIYDATFVNIPQGAVIWESTRSNNVEFHKREVIRIEFGHNYPVTITDNHIKIGCQCHSIEEWKSFDVSTIYEMDGDAAVMFHGKILPMIIALAENRYS